ncbi:podocan-like protein 1 isoform X2 [Anthonomus grandis grandis]|uniref:podocan-like protein 1 isoform X2 n=1 Tax=Anthonomus grandis grandis TaxID=2921223 RepID=UPI002165AF17|nr:podocan-like protein 1 isoform X2 [Anthonomus grandis grandis]
MSIPIICDLKVYMDLYWYILVTCFCCTYMLPSLAFNGELAEKECPDECDCHYFRINWVTDCSNSNLTEIPYDELSMDVYILDLNDNLISEVEPFPPDIKIRRLQMADNLMTELKKESFRGLTYLIDADFSENRIKRIDTDLFPDSAGFITLELQNNPLEPVDGPFLAISTLLYLDISNCSLQYLNDQFFENISALTTLDLSDNPFTILETRAFENLTSLETLKLNNCNLSYIGDNTFKALDNLKNLELSLNHFSHQMNWDIVLANLPLLENFDLRNSNVHSLTDTMFFNNHYIRVLVLAENPLSDIDVGLTIKVLSNLEVLDLSYCNLTIPLSEDTFANVTRIRSLYLSGNTLFASDLLVALSPLTNLQKLSLSNCDLRRLPDTFHKFKSLQELDISYNPLNDAFVKLLTPLETLEYLNMGYSNLSHIAPTSFSKMTSMRRLILSGNDLNNLEAGLFTNLTHLESLELNNCGLRRPLNATLFFNNFTYTDLTELQLAGNPLRVSKTGPLLPKQLSRLLTLDLSKCNLTFLPPDAFFWTRNITTLILAGNYFSSPNAFHFLELLPNLEVLDLTYNNLSTFSPREIEFNKNLNKLKLIGNPWKCDCSVADLWDWAHMEKGDLSVLEGSTIGAADLTVGKHKRKRLLVCKYDEKIGFPLIMNKTVAGRKPFKHSQRTILASNRTWAKYVRESGCEPSPNFFLSRSSRSIESRGYVNAEGITMPLAEHLENTWSSAALNAVAVYAFVMAVIGALILVTRRLAFVTNSN